MRIKKAKILNIKSIANFEMEFDSGPGWHVILGNNGAGKSTIIKAISLALISTPNVYQLSENWQNWVANGVNTGKITLDLLGGLYDGTIGEDKETSTRAWLKITRGEKKTKLAADRNYELLEEVSDWFSAAYGPYRRFEGDDPKDKDLKSASGKLGAHSSVFKPGIALAESIAWLKQLKFKALEEKGKDNTKTLNNILKFINNSGLLPLGVEISQVNSEGIFLNDANGNVVSIYELSDGYRSVLSLVLDLCRELHSSETMLIFQEKDDLINVTAGGVVMIDEADVHLHPTWQVQIGDWFKKHFPNIQFIVTTHSPLICQAADSIWKLAEPGTDEKSRKIKGIEFQRLVYGNVLEAYGTGVFGDRITRSSESYEMLRELARLNIKSIKEGLEGKEEEEYLRLKSILPTQES